MAKIIKQGKLHIRTWRHKCSQCGSLIEFEKDDYKSDQREGDYFICPVCKKWISARKVVGLE